MNKKNIKIIIVVILTCTLSAVFYQIVVTPLIESLSEVEKNIKYNTENLLTKNIKAYLFVNEKKYDVEIKERSTAFEVMEILKKETKPPKLFDFKYKEYPGLGIFIEEINGVKGGGGGYWVYYVNEKEASVGVSNYKIKNGDIISWKYEK